jgi:hypothetical protein
MLFGREWSFRLDITIAIQLFISFVPKIEISWNNFDWKLL